MSNIINKDFTDGNLFDNNTLQGTNQNDVIFADYGNDRVRGLLGDDDIYGNIGNDKLYGDGGNDELYGDGGNDELYGGQGDDNLYGGNGFDLLSGGSGDNLLSGGQGADVMRSNDLNNQDRFFYNSPGEGGNKNIGFDQIKNFDTDPGKSSLEDLIVVKASGFIAKGGATGLTPGASAPVVLGNANLGSSAGFRFFHTGIGTGRLDWDPNGGFMSGSRTIAFFSGDAPGLSLNAGPINSTNIEVI